MGLLTTLLAITAVGHSLLAAGVYVDARRTGRAPTRWTTLTLLTGVVGVGAYVYTRLD